MRNVIFSSDDRGADYLTIAVHSLLKRVAPAQPLTVNVLAGLGGFSPEHTARLEKVVANYPFAKLAWLDVDTLIADDISPLFDLDLQGNVLAAVYEDERGDHGAGLWRNGNRGW